MKDEKTNEVLPESEVASAENTGFQTEPAPVDFSQVASNEGGNCHCLGPDKLHDHNTTATPEPPLEQ